MALTQSAWTEDFVNGVYTASCTVISTTAENDAYTKKTPDTGKFDPSLPWTLFYFASATPDAQALPFDLWIGYDESFATKKATPQNILKMVKVMKKYYKVLKHEFKENKN